MLDNSNLFKKNPKLNRLKNIQKQIFVYANFPFFLMASVQVKAFANGLCI
jgi:hypothetical protein